MGGGSGSTIVSGTYPEFTGNWCDASCGEVLRSELVYDQSESLVVPIRCFTQDGSKLRGDKILRQAIVESQQIVINACMELC